MTEKDKIELMRRFEPFGREIPKDQVMSVIARVPTTDRPTAKWTTNKLGYFECTACETMLFMKQRDWRFCPFCGAVLEGEDE